MHWTGFDFDGISGTPLEIDSPSAVHLLEEALTGTALHRPRWKKFSTVMSYVFTAMYGKK